MVDILNEEFGVEDKAIEVMHSYFKDIHYTIEMEQHKSKQQKLDVGSGQGSVMSSMGFALDVNQLSIIPKSTISMDFNTPMTLLYDYLLIKMKISIMLETKHLVVLTTYLSFLCIMV